MRLTLDLPWPPSINHYWRRSPRGGNFISSEGKKYLKLVGELLMVQRVRKVEGDLSLTIALNPPDRRRRDLDNSLKVLIDAIAKGGAMADDYQIKRIEATMLEVVPGGRAVVHIEPLKSLKGAA